MVTAPGWAKFRRRRMQVFVVMESVSVEATTTPCAAARTASCASSTFVFTLFLRMPRFSVFLALCSEVSSFFGFRRGFAGTSRALVVSATRKGLVPSSASAPAMGVPWEGSGDEREMKVDCVAGGWARGGEEEDSAGFRACLARHKPGSYLGRIWVPSDERLDIDVFASVLGRGFCPKGQKRCVTDEMGRRWGCPHLHQPGPHIRKAMGTQSSQTRRVPALNGEGLVD